MAIWGVLAPALIAAAQQTVQAGMNFFSQGEQQKWERDTLAESWNREDNAIQRRVADLRASGLSPVLASGQGAGTSGPIRSTPPQIELDPMQMAMQTLALQAQQTGIEKTKAETDNIKLQKNKIQAETNAINLATDINASSRDTKLDLLKTELDFKKAINPENLRRANLQNTRAGIENRIALVDEQINKINLDKATIEKSLLGIKESIEKNFSTARANTDLLSKQALLQLLIKENIMKGYDLKTNEKLGLTWWAGAKDILQTIGEGNDIITSWLPFTSGVKKR